jgi:hypothetical protein
MIPLIVSLISVQPFASLTAIFDSNLLCLCVSVLPCEPRMPFVERISKETEEIELRLLEELWSPMLSVSAKGE